MADVKRGGASGIGLTAAHVAVALVVAAKITGADVSRVFEAGPANRRTRVMAAAGLASRLGCSNLAAARPLKVCGPELSPSMLNRVQITTDHLLVVAEALHVHGLTGPVGAAATPPAPAPAPVAAPVAAPMTSRPARPVVARSPGAARTVRVKPVGRSSVARVKPVTSRITGWAGWFLEAGNWTSEEVADLFDVDPEALLTALEADGVSG